MEPSQPASLTTNDSTSLTKPAALITDSLRIK
jgi:hypothetical protein